MFNESAIKKHSLNYVYSPPLTKQHTCSNVPTAVQNTFGTHFVIFIEFFSAAFCLQTSASVNRSSSAMFIAAGTGRN